MIIEHLEITSGHIHNHSETYIRKQEKGEQIIMDYSCDKEKFLSLKDENYLILLGWLVGEEEEPIFAFPWEKAKEREAFHKLYETEVKPNIGLLTRLLNKNKNILSAYRVEKAEKAINEFKNIDVNNTSYTELQSFFNSLMSAIDSINYQLEDNKEQGLVKVRYKLRILSVISSLISIIYFFSFSELLYFVGENENYECSGTSVLWFIGLNILTIIIGIFALEYYNNRRTLIATFFIMLFCFLIIPKIVNKISIENYCWIKVYTERRCGNAVCHDGVGGVRNIIIKCPPDNKFQIQLCTPKKNLVSFGYFHTYTTEIELKQGKLINFDPCK